MKVLLTGGTGFIGSPVSRILQSYGVDLTLAIHDTSPKLSIFERSYNVVRTDLLSEGSRRNLLHSTKPDMLIHLAWYATPNNFWHSPANFDWLYASIDILKLFAENGGKRCIMAGTGAEYDWSKGGCFHEDSTPTKPATFYGIAKDSLHKACQGYAAILGISFLWCRLFWPYGPGEPEGRLLSSLVKSFRDGVVAHCRASNLRRDYMHVEDIAQALVCAAFSSCEGSMNIASGKAVSLGELAINLANYFGRQDLLRLGTVPINEESPEEIYADVNKLSAIYKKNCIYFNDWVKTL